MMDWIWRSAWKIMRQTKNWQMALAVCACFIFTTMGSAGAGIVKPPEDGVIGGRTWCDLNEDGKRQKGEPLLSDVNVTLRKIGDDGKWADLKTATTNARGRYQFKNLELGAYLVVFEDKGLTFTKANIGNDKLDSDVVKNIGRAGRTGRITLNANDPTNLSTDAGYVDCGTPEPKDGVIAGVTWCDENEDGQRQANEAIVPEVCVKLEKLMPNGQYEIVATTITDDQGRYKFEELPLGTYVVAWCDKNLAFTAPDVGDDCKDSDVIDQSDNIGTSAQIVLDADHPTSLCTDAGYVGCSTPDPNDGVIGGRAWCDLNEDGKRQDNDTPIQDVSVTLKKRLPGGQLEIVASTTTNNKGRYEFKELPLGTYVVEFDDNDSSFTVANKAGDCKDSDVIDLSGGKGITDDIVLDADNPTSPCTDAGYVGCEISGPCIEITEYDNYLTYDKYRKLMVFVTWISWSQLEDLGVDLPHQYDRADDDFSNSMKVVEGDFTEFRQELTNLGAKWVRLEPEGSWSYLKLRINAPTSGPNWKTDHFNQDYVAQLPPTLKFTIKIVYKGQEQEICLDIPYRFIKRRISSPIALDTNGSGAVERITGEFEFDFAANGKPVKATEWFASTEGILVDTRIPGPMTGAHLFGDMDGRYADGYAKLATLDADGNGQVSGVELQGLALWTDANSNAKLDEGELSSLATHQIISLSTRHMNYMSTVTLANGATMVAEDLWFPVILPPPATPVALPMVSTKVLTISLGGALLLTLLIMAAHRSRRAPTSGAV